MDWIFDNFQIVVLIGIAFASWLKHRFDTKMAEREAQETNQDEDFEPADGWEPQQYQPQPSVPPPLVRQATPPPLIREAPAQHSREYEADLILKRQNDMQERIRQIKESKANTTGGAAATRARVAASQSKVQPIQAEKTGLRRTIRNPREIRKAVVMREILGPPVGLR
jgi:hypothetical protein